MGLQDVVRWFLPKEDHFYRFLEQQAAVAHQGAEAFAKFVPGSKIADVEKEVQRLEHEGDRVVHELEEALQKTFVTPIDREDLQLLSMELDSILDLTNSAARACSLFGVSSPTEPMTKLMALLVLTTSELARALPLLGKHQYTELLAARRTLRQLEKDADVIYRNALSELFRDDAKSPKEVLREMKVLDHIEDAIDHCERVSHTLANLAVKHG